MSKKNSRFPNEFAERLNNTLKSKGFASTRASSGVQVKELSNILGCSLQMVRKYSLGESFPDYETVKKIANWLEVSPGWLLFGEENQFKQKDLAEKFVCDYEIVLYVLQRAAPIYKNSQHLQDVTNFIMQIFYDVTHLNANKETVLKMVDMAISSAELLTNSGKKVLFKERKTK